MLLYDIVNLKTDLDAKKHLKSYLIFTLSTEKNNLTAAENAAVRNTIKQLSISINRLEKALETELKKKEGI